MIKTLEQFANAQQVIQQINELPGYFINGIGTIMYLDKFGNYRACKNTEYFKSKKLPGSGWVLVFVDGQLTIRNSFIYADKYFPEWYLYRSNKTIDEYKRLQRFIFKSPSIIDKHK